MSDLRAAVLQLARSSGARLVNALALSLCDTAPCSAAASIAAAQSPKTAAAAPTLQDDQHDRQATAPTKEAPASHSIVTDGRGRHTALANARPWVLNVSALLKKSGKPEKD